MKLRPQWQAQFFAQAGAGVAVLGSDTAAVVAVPLDAGEDVLFFEPPLKSVAYQPLPLS